MTKRTNIGHHPEIVLHGGPLDGKSIYISPLELAEEIRYAWTDDEEECTTINEAFYKVTGAIFREDDLTYVGVRTLTADYITTLRHVIRKERPE